MPINVSFVVGSPCAYPTMIRLNEGHATRGLRFNERPFNARSMMVVRSPAAR